MNSALLIIDMLNDFVSPDGVLYSPLSARTIPHIKKQLEIARSNKLPIFYICDSHLKTDKEFEKFPPHCVKGSWGARIIDELTPVDGERIIEKRRYSAFLGTDLDISLKELGINELIITGVVTNICILYTSYDARMLGYEVIIPRSCVASFSEDIHKFVLSELENTLGVKITD
ncbi:MAG TPA: isochorismatase family cysteine hydrolase [bacterium]|mgnify:FL=1|nr:isochorismatase family cysteine hydrolase [bacterium]HRU31894.1 isochorismatase family cysteine hydrolase [bacterium]